MSFSTLTFLVFLALVFGLYWGLRKRTAQNLLLVLASYFFYAWWDWRFCFLMLISATADYVIGLALERTDKVSVRRWLLGGSLFVNLGLLGFFKYFNFFAENLQVLASTLGFVLDPITLNVILPVGISFYTFQTLSYTIDIYRRKLKPTRQFISYMAYVSFFPQLVAGPIERASRLLPQFLAPRRFDEPLARDGVRQMLIGFFKKMVLADNLALIVNQAYADPEATSGVVLALATVCFAFQIYYDFSGYSDIAIGCARLFGIKLMRNFAYPYFSQSVAEFWRRWHISLSTWFRDYVYIPLGGSRSSMLRRVGNIMVTFVVSGFWHGASWNFGIWGAINGAGIVPPLLSKRSGLRLGPADTPGGEAFWIRPGPLLRIIGTFSLICVTWVFFRAATLPDAWLILGKIIHDVWFIEGYRVLVAEVFNESINIMALSLTMLFTIWEWINRRHEHVLTLKRVPWPVRWVIYTMLVLAIVWLGIQSTQGFIYFQF